jgi:hypothetical protein
MKLTYRRIGIMKVLHIDDMFSNLLILGGRVGKEEKYEADIKCLPSPTDTLTRRNPKACCCISVYIEESKTCADPMRDAGWHLTAIR